MDFKKRGGKKEEVGLLTTAANYHPLSRMQYKMRGEENHKMKEPRRAGKTPDAKGE